MITSRDLAMIRGERAVDVDLPDGEDGLRAPSAAPDPELVDVVERPVVTAVVQVRGADDPAGASVLGSQLRRLAAAGATTIVAEIDPAGRPVAFEFLRRLARLRAELLACGSALAVIRARSEGLVREEGTVVGGIVDATTAPLADVFAVHQLIGRSGPPVGHRPEIRR
jgi:hypothetical protein